MGRIERNSDLRGTCGHRECGSTATHTVGGMIGGWCIKHAGYLARGVIGDEIYLGGRTGGETDPTGRGQHDLGAKLDAGKPPVVRGALHYFPNALRAVAEVSAIGAEKYAWGSWLHVPDGAQRYFEALGRHVLAEATEKLDPDTEKRHAAHAAWNALARLELLERQEHEED